MRRLSLSLDKRVGRCRQLFSVALDRRSRSGFSCLGASSDHTAPRRTLSFRGYSVGRGTTLHRKGPEVSSLPCQT